MMQLIGMLDSPYVRRVAISLRLLDVPFEHRPLSVFGDFEAFAQVNPLVKAPTLITAEGTLLTDSTLILDHLESLAAPEWRLMPTRPEARLANLHTLGLALATCEKAVQIVYETHLRPADRQHQPWLDRVSRQLLAGCAALEAEEAARNGRRMDAPLDQAGLSLAVIWSFIQAMLAERVRAADHPALDAWARHAERLPAFVATPAR